MKLKTTFFLALFFSFFLALNSSAQIQIGAKVGINSTTLTSNNFNIEDVIIDSLDLYYKDFTALTNTKYRFGLHAGAYAVIDFGVVNIMAEALWSMKGANNFGLNRKGNPANIELHYLSLPILVNIDITDVFTIQAGPQVGILLDSRQKTGRGGSYPLNGKIGDEGDLTGIVGLKVKILNIGHLTARCEFGFTPALSLLTTQGNQFEYKNQSFQVGLGIPLFKVKN